MTAEIKEFRDEITAQADRFAELRGRNRGGKMLCTSCQMDLDRYAPRYGIEAYWSFKDRLERECGTVRGSHRRCDGK